VTVGGAADMCDIEDKHEQPCHELGGRNLGAFVSVVYSETVEERLIGHCERFCTACVYS